MAITTIPEVREEIQENINTNNNRAITGQVLQTTLVDMLDTVDDVKANTTGYYEGMSVGLADNLISPDTENNSASWLYRSTAGDKDVSSGFATIEGMKGNTIVWNQRLIPNPRNFGGMTCEYNPDTNQFHVYGTILSSGNGSTFSWSDTIFSSGNKVYLKVYKVDGTYSSAGYISDQYSSPRISIPLSGGSGIYVVGSGNFCIPQILQVQEGDVFDIYYKVSLCDLTKMFGSDAGIVSALGLSSVDDITTNDGIKCCEAFERLFPQSYYAYDEGSLLSFNPTDIQTTGFNQYDNSKQTENVHVLADNKYRIKGTYNGLTYSDGTDVTVTDGYFTPDRVDRLTLTGGNNLDTCVHLSWSGYRDGVDDYEKYWSVNTDLSWIRTLEHNGSLLFPNGLCKAGDVYDEISDGKAIKRVGVVDLGTLSWTYIETGTYPYYEYQLEDAKGAYPSSMSNLVCAKYPNRPATVDYGNSVGISIYAFSGTSPKIRVFDGSYTSASEFKTAMNGVMLYYELATPIIVDLPDGINLNYRMDDFGTEEFINTTAASDVPGLCKPTLADIGYQTNLRDKIRRLDENYVSLNLQENSESKKLTARQNIDAASTSGSYPQMTVGNLIADVDTPREFTFEETGGGGTVVGNGYADVKKVEGNTIVWNQTISQNVIITDNVDGWKTFDSNTTITSGGSELQILKSSGYGIAIYTLHENTIISGHIYYLAVDIKTTAPDNSIIVGAYAVDTTIDLGRTQIASNSWQRLASVRKCISAASQQFRITDTRSSNFDTVYAKNFAFIDLTKMFGAGNEPTTVEEFERLFPMEYAPYCEGRLVSLGGYKIKWNQMIQNGNFNDIQYWIKSWTTISANNNTLTAVAAGASPEALYQELTAVNTHKYYVAMTVQCDTNGTYHWGLAHNNTVILTANINQRVSTIQLGADNFYLFYDNLSANTTFQYQNVICVDLTEMFGPGSEPTLEEFESMFGTEYGPYDEGTEINVLQKMELQDDFSVKSTGFNLWDEEWRNDGYYGDNGFWRSADAQYISSKNMIPIFGGTAYYFKFTRYGYLYFYDAAGNFVSRVDTSSYAFAYTTPTNAAYMHFSIYYGSSVTYNHDICINLSDPAKNGTYLPYTTSTQDLSWIYDLEYKPEGSTTPEKLFPYGLLSAGTVHDEVTDTQAIKRVGVVDLGNDLTWTGGVGQNTRYTSSIIPNCKTYIWSNYRSLRHLVLFKYTLDGSPVAGNHIDNTYVIYTDGVMYVNDYTCESLESFSNYMKNRLLYYELETPITVTFPSPKDLGYNVQSGGTEQLLPSNPIGTGPITAPIIESVNYPLDAVGTLTNLPRNYISVESMDSFTTALGNTLNLNISKTWDSANNKWSFSVTSRS